MGINPARDSKKLRNILGVQLQASGLPASISVEEAMKLFSNYHGLSPRYDLLHRFGLKEKMKTQYHMLSVGQQRRLVLALAIAHNPKVVILDEPTAGLDVASRVELHEIMNELRKGGTTIILATHDMAEAEKMGATGLFHEQYDETVKVYLIGDFSKEICGGPHAENTGSLGHFRILKEESAASGVRRIKAVLSELE
jgi:ABC-type multidrug transport system ATPase subunit